MNNVDINKYAKTWYEIGRFPHRFEKKLTHVSATYQILPNGKISVLNKGYNAQNKLKQIKGIAWIPNLNESNKLKVRFFWPFAAPYWIEYLDHDYTIAIVGGPSKKYLWILADKPKIDDNTYQFLLNKAKELGYNIEKIEKVSQEKNTY